MDTLAIIKRIEMRLAEIGMSKADFYEKSGISSASYSQWNTGKFNPTPKKIRSAAECLGLSYDYLATGSEQTKKAPAGEGGRVSEDAIKIALFGGGG
ncbi:hypothetical protein KL86CLO1_10453 [uncultured Eubacteriales bacterium]|uniref:HTH cro/C1-type domain-containing protein n=1 Tax=uncultured Eubacteriales bacterium TaxID=172733 RepID=A0A212J3J9_9FIRM|nr:hypothetical protein KL86CLO1_10453 [uncultured Eubacteriales bacterium]